MRVKEFKNIISNNNSVHYIEEIKEQYNYQWELK